MFTEKKMNGWIGTIEYIYIEKKMRIHFSDLINYIVNGHLLRINMTRIPTTYIRRFVQ